MCKFIVYSYSKYISYTNPQVHLNSLLFSTPFIIFGNRLLYAAAGLWYTGEHFHFIILKHCRISMGRFLHSVKDRKHYIKEHAPIFVFECLLNTLQSDVCIYKYNKRTTHVRKNHLAICMSCHAAHSTNLTKWYCLQGSVCILLYICIFLFL